MPKETREVWAKRVERWKDSGLTSEEFAAETGISAQSAVVVAMASREGVEGAESGAVQASAEAGSR